MIVLYCSCTETHDISQEEVVRKTQSFERLKGEAEKCLSQSEKFRNEKTEFESAVYAKVYYAVLTSALSDFSLVNIGLVCGTPTFAYFYTPANVLPEISI